jgi:hypothetical protein
VSTPVGEKPAARREERPPDWSALEPDVDSISPRAATIRRILGAAVVFVLLGWLGHWLAAVGLALVIASVTAASARFEAVGRTVQRVERAVSRVAGRALTFVLLSVVQLLVFTPLWLLLKLLRRDPLALGSAPDAPTFWRPHLDAPGRSLDRRPFAYERLPGMGGQRSRLATAVAVVAILLVLDVGAGLALDALRDDEQAPATNLLLAPDVPAGRQEPWRAQISTEIVRAFEGKAYDPFLGWRVDDYDGRYVHVAGGVRRSYEPASAGDPVEVVLFGGSTMFGAFQRDEHTIPSELARLAEADGIPVHVVNRGQLAYMNWQEVLEFQTLVSGGARPDLTVFYDGFNELLSQFAAGPHRAPTHLSAAEVEERLGFGRQAEEPSDATRLYHAWRDVSVGYGLGRSLGVLPSDKQTVALRSPWTGSQDDHPERRGADAAYVQARGVQVAKRLADSYGLRTAFAWQPFLYSKHVVPGEEELVGWLASDPDAWRAATRAARARLDRNVIDLSDALDGVRAPVMYDMAHTNELGAHAIAEALYRRLRPALLDAWEAKRR